MARLFTDVCYVVADDRKTRPRLTEGATLFMCCLGVDCVFIGWNGQLWRCNAYDRSVGPIEYYWVTRLEHPKLHLYVEERKPRRISSRSSGYRFECYVYEHKACPRHTFYEGVMPEVCYNEVHRAQLQNMNHALIRLQRWIRRVLWQRRAKSVLLMALHPRAGCALGGLGRDIVEGVLMGMAFKAGV